MDALVRTTTVKARVSVTPAEIAACAALFSAHYGTWSPRGLRPGQRISMIASRLYDACLFDEDCGVVLHHAGGVLVGHAFFRRFMITCNVGGAAVAGPVVWVTQLVVATAERGRHVASEMLLRLCSRDLVAFGLLSSHPHAVRALEHAAHLDCQPKLIAKAAPALQASARVPYFRAEDIIVDTGRCVVSNGFFVDHTAVDDILSAYLAQGHPFELGPLDQGEEFIAVVFPTIQRRRP